MTRRVLVVTYFFPPLGGVGVQRTLKFVRYLPQWGWQPVVLTPRDPAYWVRDESLMAELPPGLEVHRTACYEPAWLVAAIKRRLRLRDATVVRAARTPLPPLGGTAAQSVGASVAATGLLSLASAAWRRGVRLVLYPDEQLGWLPPALREGRRIDRQAPFEVILSSSPPISSHLIAGVLKQTTKRPWVADFRDPWLGNAFAAPVPRHQRWLQRRLERWIVARADGIVLASPTLLADFIRRYPAAAARCVYIPNGYDRAELEDLPQAPPREPGRYRLVYAGSIYGRHELEIFLAGLELLVGRRPDLARRLRVEFIGWLNRPNQALAAHYVQGGRLGEIVTFTGFLARRDALASMAEADALLQLIGDEAGKEAVIGAKLLEYLAFDKPILAVVPNGDARRILEELRWGVIADPTPAGAADGLERLLDEAPPARPADPDGRYDRVRLAARLADVLGSVAVARARPGGAE
jgi:glycosyltransferase involved in cell wall biosynthesis